MKAVIICFFSIYFLSESTDSYAQDFDFGTESQKALEYYHLAWKQILDLGEWTNAEESFRKSVQIDPDFLLAWSQVGRISNDPEERKFIFEMLNKKKSQLNGFQKELLETYMGSLEIIDLKDRGLPVHPNLGKAFLAKLYQSSQSFLKEYPDETYIEAEYIEAIHSIYGAKSALDSLAKRNLLDKSPFFISYRAMLQAETNNFVEAHKSLKILEEGFGSSQRPALSYTKAYINKEEGKLEEAEISLKECLKLDPKHTLAKRMLLNLY